jgi:hypothetical protein
MLSTRLLFQCSTIIPLSNYDKRGIVNSSIWFFFFYLKKIFNRRLTVYCKIVMDTLLFTSP